MTIGNHNLNKSGLSQLPTSNTPTELQTPMTKQNSFNTGTTKLTGFDSVLLTMSGAGSSDSELAREYVPLDELSEKATFPNEAYPYFNNRADNQSLLGDSEERITDIQHQMSGQQYLSADKPQLLQSDVISKGELAQFRGSPNGTPLLVGESVLKPLGRTETLTSSIALADKAVTLSDLKVTSEADPSLKRELVPNLLFKASVSTKNNTTAEVGQKLVNILADKINLQSNSRVSNATIRLDPPELGKLDLFVRVEGDRLNIQINSSVNNVRDAIAQTIERLRLELVQDNFLEVNVSVGDNHQSEPDWQSDNVESTLVKRNNLLTSDTELTLTQAEQIIARV